MANNSSVMHEEETEREVALLNIERARRLIIIVMVIEFVLMLADDYSLYKLTTESIYENCYALMYLALILISILYLCTLPRMERLLNTKSINPWKVEALIIFYFIVALAWGAVISETHNASGSLSVFVVVLMLGSMLLILDSISLMLPYLVAILIFALTGPGDLGHGEMNIRHYLNLAIYLVLAWSISRTLYTSYINEFADRRLIEVQNRMLKEANEDLIKEAHLKQEAQEKLELVNRELVNMSMLDELTGIANRRSLEYFLNYEWNRAYREKSSLAILMIDIDSFKAFNDGYGHVVGDQALIMVAHKLNECRRRSSDFVARYGGEEFLFIALNMTEEGTAILADMLRQHVENMNIPHANSLISPWVTISVGSVTLFPDQVEEAREAIHMADRALYEAKKAGGNTVRAFLSPQDTLF